MVSFCLVAWRRLSRYRRARQVRGFSLLELLLVLGILAIVSAIAAPQYAKAAARYRIEAAAQRIVADLELAQRRARTIGASQTVTFAVVSDSYQLAGAAHLDKPATVYTVNLAAEPYRVDLQSASFAGFPTVAYNGYGQPSAGGVIVLQTSATGMKVIVVDAQSGKGVVQ